MIAIRAAANALVAALIAPPCVACGRVLDHPLDGAACDACWETIDRGVSPVLQLPPLIATGAAIGEYEGPLRDIIHALKYEGRRSVATRLARLMAEHGSHILDGAELVVPVPLHWRRQRQRGFNQAEDLARGLGLPVRRWLRRVQSTRPQIELPAGERHLNVAGAFSLNLRPGRMTDHGRRGPLDGLTIVLVDDVTTTGATLEACARVLRRAGAREIRALTAARVATERRPAPCR